MKAAMLVVSAVVLTDESCDVDGESCCFVRSATSGAVLRVFAGKRHHYRQT